MTQRYTPAPKNLTPIGLAIHLPQTRLLLVLVEGRISALWKALELTYLVLRVCPGNHFAEASIFITMCTILSVFNVKPTCDEEGREMLPTAEMSPNRFVW